MVFTRRDIAKSDNTTGSEIQVCIESSVFVCQVEKVLSACASVRALPDPVSLQTTLSFRVLPPQTQMLGGGSKLMELMMWSRDSVSLLKGSGQDMLT